MGPAATSSPARQRSRGKRASFSAKTRVAMACACALASLARTTNAEAAGETRRVHLSVDAPCTSDADFGRRLGERTGHAVAVEDAENADLVRVRILVEGSKAEGSFEIVRGSEPARSRRVAGTTCDEVADVLSLALALTYDREALQAPLPPLPPLPPPPLPTRAPAVVVSPPGLSAVETPPVPKPPWRWDLGGHVTLAGQNAWPLGAEVFADLARGRGPSFRLGVEGRFATTHVQSAAVDLVWLLATPSICPIHFGSRFFDIAPCAGATVGAIWVTTSNVPDERTILRPAVAPRGALFASIVLTRRISLDMQAAIEVPLTRANYKFGNIVAYSIPRVTPTFAVGVTFALTR